MYLTRKYNAKTKKNVFYDTRTKKRVTMEHLNKLYIPPAYSNVKISSNPDSKVLATGIDSRGRKQYIYNKAFTEEQSILKFSDLKIFGKKIRRIRNDVWNTIMRYNRSRKKSLDLLLSQDFQIALVIYLVDKCNFRIGNSKYKHLYQSYGITTINSEHIDTSGSSGVEIRFTGKKGVENKANVCNKYIGPILRDLKRVNCNREYLFSYINENREISRITERHINNYLKRYNPSITVKMFRTWAANYTLLRELIKMGTPDCQTKTRKNIKLAVNKSAHSLHHTAGVSKKSYMNNEILDLYESNPNAFFAIIRRYRGPTGRLPDTDRIFNRLLEDINY